MKTEKAEIADISGAGETGRRDEAGGWSARREWASARRAVAGRALAGLVGVSVMCVSLMGVSLMCGGVGRAQTGVAAAAATKPAVAVTGAAPVTAAKSPAAQAAVSPAQGPHEGVKVHGYWIIEVRNADGTVARHMEFENQLCTTFTDLLSSGSVPGGDSTLSALLSGTASPGAWSILLGNQATTVSNGQTVTGPNCDMVPQFVLPQAGVQIGNAVRLGALADYIPLAFPCLTSGFTPSYTCVPGLTVASPSSGPGVALSQTFTVPTTAAPITISAVGTDLYTCAGSANTPAPTPLDCQQLGVDAESNLYTGGEPTSAKSCIYSSMTTGPAKTTWKNCVPSSTQVETTVYSVAGTYGRSPFSGVVLTGTGGVPAAFKVSGGQTVAVTWTLTFQ